MTSEGI